MSKPKNLELLAALVASGRTIKDSAEVVGITPATAYSISGTSEFKIEVARIRDEAVQQAVGVLNAGVTRAAETLVELLGSDNEAKDRLAAARLIMANLTPISELGELRSRITALESQPVLKVAQ